MDIELLDHQDKFLASKKKYSLLLGGIGSGKTYAGCLYVLIQVCTHPNALGFIGANTQKQLINSTLSCLFKVLGDGGVEYTWNQQKGLLKIGTTLILCSSLENYDMLRGIELGWGWIDEAAYLKNDGAFKMLMGRLRDKKGPMQMRLTTTPKGYNWLHSWFEKGGDNYSEETEYFLSSTYQNPHIPKEYIKSLETQFDSQLIKQELQGEFVNVQAGRIYYAFNREISTHRVNWSGQPLVIGMDFNISPLCSVVSYIEGDCIYIFDEFFMKDSNTQAMANAIKAKYGSKNVSIIPDYSGIARKTSSHTTDHEILQIAGFKVIKRKNPFRMNRYNCVNNLFDKKRIIIDPKCKNTIRDLEQLSFKEGTSDPDLTSKDLGHISDALGYLCWYAFPLRASRDNMTIEFF